MLGIIKRTIDNMMECERKLDQTWPDWYWRVDPKTLHMESSCHCVMGQLCGRYGNRPPLFVNGTRLGLIAHSVPGYLLLTWLWRRLIYRRRSRHPQGGADAPQEGG